MQKITMPPNSFIAYIGYNETSKQLYITLRKGKQYLVEGFSAQEFKTLSEANNKGNYVSQHVIHNDKFTLEYLGVIPQATIEAFVLPQTKYYTNHLAR